MNTNNDHAFPWLEAAKLAIDHFDINNCQRIVQLTIRDLEAAGICFEAELDYADPETQSRGILQIRCGEIRRATIEFVTTPIWLTDFMISFHEEDREYCVFDEMGATCWFCGSIEFVSFVPCRDQ